MAAIQKGILNDRDAFRAAIMLYRAHPEYLPKVSAEVDCADSIPINTAHNQILARVFDSALYKNSIVGIPKGDDFIEKPFCIFSVELCAYDCTHAELIKRTAVIDKCNSTYGLNILTHKLIYSGRTKLCLDTQNSLIRTQHKSYIWYVQASNTIYNRSQGYVVYDDDISSAVIVRDKILAAVFDPGEIRDLVEDAVVGISETQCPIILSIHSRLMEFNHAELVQRSLSMPTKDSSYSVDDITNRCELHRGTVHACVRARNELIARWKDYTWHDNKLYAD